MTNPSRPPQIGKVSSELPKMEGIHGTAHHVRARPPFVLLSSGRVAGMLPRPLVAGSAHVSTLPRTCTVGLSPSRTCVHEHSSTSKRNRERRISVLLGYSAAPFVHGSQPDAKIAPRSKLWAANNHLCSRDKIRGGTRELEVPQARPAVDRILSFVITERSPVALLARVRGAHNVCPCHPCACASCESVTTGVSHAPTCPAALGPPRLN